MPPNDLSVKESLYTKVMKVWDELEDPGLMGIHHRIFLTQTIGGFLQTVFRSAAEVRVKHGVMHLPDSILPDTLWWPSDPKGGENQLLTYTTTPSTGWFPIQQLPKNWTHLNREIWFAWTGELGELFLVARKIRRGRKIPLFSDEEWQISVSTERKPILTAMQIFKNVWEYHPGLEQQSLLMQAYLEKESDDKIPRPSTNRPTLLTAVTLAENLDQWTRKRLYEAKWATALHRVQDAVAWELRSDRLMQSIGTILKGIFDYDYIDIHIFQRVGKRYEAFLSWRRNYTGFSDDQFTLLLTERLVVDVLRSRRPRVIKLNHPDGLMNPQLAELAGLDEGVIIPLIQGNTVVGLVILCYRKPVNLTTKDLTHVSHIGRVIAKSIAASNAHTRVHRMATVDGLTNVYNRRFFNEQIQKEMKRAKRYNHNITLIIIDIDNFKHYNDTNGHLMGDRILRQFSEVLKGSVRDDDLVARYGGEEFVVVLPYSDVKKGVVVAEKIRREVLLTPFPNGEKQPLGRVSISLGVADNQVEVETPQDLINHADQALYKAKQSGRNQTVIYSQDLDSL